MIEWIKNLIKPQETTKILVRKYRKKVNKYYGLCGFDYVDREVVCHFGSFTSLYDDCVLIADGFVFVGDE